MRDRAILFVDGNNWYHSLKKAAVTDLGQLNYQAISEKLVGPREWLATRYYIGRVPQVGDPRLYAAQRRFLAFLESTDGKISTHLGRLERRPVEDPAAKELLNYLAKLSTRIDQDVFHDLMAIAKEHSDSTVMVEKAVDGELAVDMVVMAERDEFDAAYLLSADGDFTPAAEAVMRHGKKVYAVSLSRGAQLAAAVTSFIRLEPSWFSDCYI